MPVVKRRKAHQYFSIGNTPLVRQLHAFHALIGGSKATPCYLSNSFECNVGGIYRGIHATYAQSRFQYETFGGSKQQDQQGTI